MSHQISRVFDRPFTSRPISRFVLIIGILAGVVSIATAPLLNPDQISLASDVYVYAARSMLDGESIYGVHPPNRPGYFFLYPPVVVYLFVPHALLGSDRAAFLLQTGLNVLAAGGTAWIIYRALRRRGMNPTTRDLAILFGFVLVSPYGAIHLVNGQVTLWLGLLLALGLFALEGGRQRVAGVAFAVAAIFKVFPAVIGLWLLRRRAYRAVLVALATGIGAIAIGWMLLGTDTTSTYFSDVLLGRYGGYTFEGTPDPGRSTGGIRRQIAAVFGVGPPISTAIALGVLVPVLGYLYRTVDTDQRRQAAVLGTVVCTLLFLPLQPLYFPLLVYPLVLLIYILPPGRPRSVVLLGTLVSFVQVGYEEALTMVAVVVSNPSLLSAIETSLGRAFTFILPPTAGMWLLLLGCILVVRDANRSTGGESPVGYRETTHNTR